MNAHGRWNIMIVDDHPIVRGGLCRLLAQQPDMHVCAEAGSAPEARKLAIACRPDLIIVDLRLGNGDGLELIKCFRVEVPASKLMVLSQHAEKEYVERAVRAGAKGYVLKEQDPDDILKGIRSIMAGEFFLSPILSSHLIFALFGGNSTQGNNPPGLENLTDRELGVLRLIGEGRTTREAATILQLSIKTVDSHRENIKRKIGARNAAELVHYATLWVRGSVPPGSPPDSPSASIRPT